MLRLISLFLISCFLMGLAANVSAQQAEKIADFRGLNMKLALIDLDSSLGDKSLDTRVIEGLRKAFNRYVRTFGFSTVSSFKIPKEASRVTYREISKPADLSEVDRKLIQQIAKDNSVDLLVLGSIKQPGSQVELALQIYDVRIETFSAIETASTNPSTLQPALDAIAHRLMNYLDRDGYIHPTSQDLLMPMRLEGVPAPTRPADDVFSVNPTDLSSGQFAGQISIGGEKTPFWETWWFWTLVGGGLIGGGLATYYLVTSSQSPTQMELTFTLP